MIIFGIIPTGDNMKIRYCCFCNKVLQDGDYENSCTECE
jgi:hypothetical protein